MLILTAKIDCKHLLPLQTLVVFRALFFFASLYITKSLSWKDRQFCDTAVDICDGKPFEHLVFVS